MKLWKTRNMAIAVIFLVLAFGIFLNCAADKKSVTGGFAMKDVQAATAEGQLDPSKSLFGSEATAETPAEEKSETAAKEEDDDSDGSEEGEVEDLPDQEWEAPGGETPMAKGTQSQLARCVQEAPQDKALIQELCPGKLQPAEICSVGDVESGGSMCLGATQGEPCKDSPKGAQGRYQFMPKTAAAWWPKAHGVGTYDPQNLAHSKRLAVAYLCYLKERVGETNMYRAYNGGPAGFDEPKSRELTIKYDQRVRNRIPMYQAALDGKVDFSNAAVMAAIAVNFSPPVPYGECWISGLFGEPRPYRHGIHQGMDMACVVGTKVLAIVDGLVVFAGEHTNTAGGQRAGIQVQLTHGNGTIGRLGGSRYFHLATVTVKTGDRVKAGQQIGTVGLTGVKRSGSHLHFESYTWGAGKKLIVCSVPGAWFPTIPFLPNAGDRYVGPKNEKSKAVGERFERLAKR